MTEIVLYHNTSQHQRHWIGCFSEGLKRHNVKHTISGSPAACDIGVVWGVRNMMADRVIVMERGYFGDRLKNTSCGWGGLNGRADFNNKDSPSDRWGKHGVEVSPWNSDGSYVLLIGQVAGDMSVDGVDLQSWYSETAQRIRLPTGMPVVFRPHPLSRTGQSVPGCYTRNCDLQKVLDSAYACVTYNSNAGVDAVFAGVPTVAMDMGSMAWDVSGHDVDDIAYMPDRTQWLNNLAYCQWTESEIRTGDAWEHLNDIDTGNSADS